MSLQVSALETQCFSFFRVQLAALHSRRTCGAVGTAHKILAELWSSPTDTSLFALFANGLEETMRTFTIANDRRQHVFCTHFKTHTITHKRWHVSNVLTAYNSAVHNECAEECTRNLPHPLRHYARLVCLCKDRNCAHVGPTKHWPTLNNILYFRPTIYWLTLCETLKQDNSPVRCRHWSRQRGLDRKLLASFF